MASTSSKRSVRGATARLRNTAAVDALNADIGERTRRSSTSRVRDLPEAGSGEEERQSGRAVRGLDEVRGEHPQRHRNECGVAGERHEPSEDGPSAVQ